MSVVGRLCFSHSTTAPLYWLSGLTTLRTSSDRPSSRVCRRILCSAGGVDWVALFAFDAPRSSRCCFRAAVHSSVGVRGGPRHVNDPGCRGRPPIHPRCTVPVVPAGAGAVCGADTRAQGPSQRSLDTISQLCCFCRSRCHLSHGTFSFAGVLELVCGHGHSL